MTPTWTSRLYARFGNGTCWPIPESPTEHGDSSAWRLLNAPEHVTKTDLYYARSCIGALASLVNMSARESAVVLRAMRAAVEMRDASPSCEMATCGAVDVDSLGGRVEDL